MYFSYVRIYAGILKRVGYFHNQYMSQTVLKQIKRLFDPDRIEGILSFSSQILPFVTGINAQGQIFTVLDYFEPRDRFIINDLRSELGSSVHIKVYYKEDLENPIWNSHMLGDFGPIYISLLPKADVLFGKNTFSQKISFESQSELQKYFNLKINSSFDSLSSLSTNKCRSNSYKKEIIKIIIYLLFLKNKLCFINSYAQNNLDIVKIAIKSEIFSNQTLCRLKDIFYDEIIDPLIFIELERFLYLDHARLFSRKDFILTHSPAKLDLEFADI